MEPAPSARVVELTGYPARLTMPDVCAHCGTPAQERIRIEKVFRRDYQDGKPSDYDIVGVSVTFCPPCAARHVQEARRIAPLMRLLMCFRSAAMLGVAGSLLLGGIFVRPLLENIAARDNMGMAMFGAVVGFFVLIAVGCARAAYGETRRFAVVEQTSITKSFDYGEDISRTFEPRRHAYTLSNPLFAEAFVTRNRDRAWDPEGPRASKARKAQKVAMALVLAAAAVWFAWEHLEGWLR
jgi:hypothetical protein